MSGAYDHEGLKALAKSMGRPLDSLYALTGWHDPFVADMPGRRAQAEWFAAIWHQFALTPGVYHDRRIHYMLVSQPAPIIAHNGKPYENTEQWFTVLTVAVRDARYLGLVPPGAVIDRCNPEPKIYLDDADHIPAAIEPPCGGYRHSDWGYSAGGLYLPRLRLREPTIPQRYHLEIWCEKSTMNVILMPLGERYRVNVVTGVGDMSTTRCEELFERLRESRKPARILYVSDFDPAGRGMPVSVARKIEFFSMKSGEALDIQLRPIVLSHEQCVEYRLPRTPIKESEARAAKFEARFGAGATQLDALEALLPGELQRIIVREIERYHDTTLIGRIRRAINKANGDLASLTYEAHAQHAHAIAALRAEAEEIAAAAEEAR
jgi:hypothetical protein